MWNLSEIKITLQYFIVRGLPPVFAGHSFFFSGTVPSMYRARAPFIASVLLLLLVTFLPRSIWQSPDTGWCYSIIHCSLGINKTWSFVRMVQRCQFNKIPYSLILTFSIYSVLSYVECHRWNPVFQFSSVVNFLTQFSIFSFYSLQFANPSSWRWFSVFWFRFNIFKR